MQAVLISFISVLAGVSNSLISSSYEPAAVFFAIFPVTDFAAAAIIFTAVPVSNAFAFLFLIYKLSRTIKTVSNL